MARAQFGGAQDNSSIFLSFYNQYENKLASQANDAANQARADQQAADQDEINKWKSGAISDEEFLAYAQQRAKDPLNEAADTTYWNQAVRDVKAQVKQRQVQTGAQAIIDGIQSGKRSYADLLKFYQSSLKGLNKNDPLYGDITTQIESVKSTMTQNNIQGALEKVQYQFQAGQLTGRQAGAQMRALATQYQKSDPKTYYQILETALGFEKYGSGTYGAGGSGGGGSSSTAVVNASIDGLQALRDIIKSASDQFDAGSSTATVGIPQADGTVKYQTIQIRNTDGTPTGDMSSLDNQLLDTYDQLAKAHIAKKDFSAAAVDLAAKSSYITKEIQPRNTIAPEKQLTALYGALQSAVATAANGIDPAGSWWTVRQIANQVQAWNTNLNTHTAYGKAPSEAQASQNPELNAASRKYGVANAAQDQTTSDFAAKAQALADLASSLSDPTGKDAMASINQSLGVLFAGTDPTSTTSKQAAAIFQGGADVVRGIASGQYALTYTSQDGYAWKPLQAIPIGPDENGAPQTTLVPVDPATGKPLFDPTKGQALAATSVDVAGHAIPVLAEATTVQVYNGKLVGPNNPVPKSSSAVGGSAPQVQTFVQVALPDPTTNKEHFWYQDPSSRLWSRDSLSSAAPAPMPFEGGDLNGAQRIANAKGLDTTQNYYSSQVMDVFTGPGHTQWFDAVQQNAASQQRQQAQQATLQRIQAGPPSGMTTGYTSQYGDVQNVVKSLGFGTAADIGSTSKPTVSRPSFTPLALPRPKTPTLTGFTPFQMPDLNLPSLAPVAPHVAPTPTLASGNGFDVRGGLLR